jgi:hypothetical protein
VTFSRFATVFVAISLVCAMFAAQAAAQGRGSSETPIPETAPPGTPTAAQGERLDLAAMALDSSVIPPEFRLFYETYIPPSSLSLRLAGLAEPSEIEATGIIAYYESSYSTPDGTAQLRSYLQQYADEQGAAAGFALFEDETRMAPNAALSDEPGPGIGEEPSEITTGAFSATVPETGPTNIDITYRIGNILAGVSMDTGADTTVDRDFALEMAQALADRITAFLGGEQLPAIDSTLPERFVGLGESWIVTNEGYWVVPEVYGPDAPPEIAQAFISGYIRADAFDPNQLGGFPLPRVAISVAEFTDEQVPLTLISNLDTLQPQFGTLEPVEIDPIPGSSVSLGFQFANTYMSDASVDSFRVIALAEGTMLTVDVQGNGSAAAAQEAAVAIATAQLACLNASTPCDVESFPDTLFASPSTPEAGSDPVG